MPVTVEEKDAIWGWHFVIQRDGETGPMLSHAPSRYPKRENYSVAPGYVYMEKCRHIKMCLSGLHFCRGLKDACYWADSTEGFMGGLIYHDMTVFLCRVRVWGEVEEENGLHGKGAARFREVVEMKEVPKRFYNQLGRQIPRGFTRFAKSFESYNGGK